MSTTIADLVERFFTTKLPAIKRMKHVPHRSPARRSPEGKRWLHLLFCLLLISSLLCSGCSVLDLLLDEKAASDSKRIPAYVERVVDGDTLVVKFDGQKERVRLLLVDTPETKHPSKPVQPFGPEASQFAKEHLEQKKIELELDVSERDRYGRLLAYVWVDDQLFNEMLLEAGLARVAYIFPPNVKYVDRFREVQKEAQLAGIGIWSIEDYARQDGFHEEILEHAN